MRRGDAERERRGDVERPGDRVRADVFAFSPVAMVVSVSTSESAFSSSLPASTSSEIGSI